MLERLDEVGWAGLGEGASRVPALLRALAQGGGRPEERALAHAELATLLAGPGGPRPAAAAAAPFLAELLLGAPEPYPVLRLLERLAESGAEAERAVASAIPALLPALELPDARTRHALAHLLAHLPSPPAAVAEALRRRLLLEKYEAVRASALLALGRLGRQAGSQQDVELLLRQLGPGVPPRVGGAAAIALCWLDPALRTDPEVARALDRTASSPELRETELEWNDGDLASLARMALEG